MQCSQLQQWKEEGGCLWRGNGVWRPLAITTGSQARPWRDPQEEIRRIGQNLGAINNLRWKDQNFLLTSLEEWAELKCKFGTFICLNRLLTGFSEKNAAVSPIVDKCLCLEVSWSVQYMPDQEILRTPTLETWLCPLASTQQDMSNNLLTRHFGRTGGMQQQRLPITIGQKCERETDVSSERQYFRHTKTRKEHQKARSKKVLWSWGLRGPCLVNNCLLGDTDSWQLSIRPQLVSRSWCQIG